MMPSRSLTYFSDLISLWICIFLLSINNFLYPKSLHLSLLRSMFIGFLPNWIYYKLSLVRISFAFSINFKIFFILHKRTKFVTLTSEFRSAFIIMKSSGAKTVLCGTELVTSTYLNFGILITTPCMRPTKRLYIYILILNRILFFFNF